MKIYNRRQAMAVLAGLAGSGIATTGIAQSKPKIAFMLNGTPGDVGWNYEHARGIAQAEAAFGDAVQIDSYYGVKEWGNGDADKMLELILNGYDLVFACSFGYGQSLIQLALAAPATKFEHCTNRIGYLASFPIPQVIRGINAAFVAARSVNPDVTFDVVWLNTWFSPPQEEEISNLLLDRGADVLLAHTNTTKPTEVAEARGAYAFGQASDMAAFGPNATLSATINNWGPYYVRRIAALLDGTWKSEDTWGGFEDEMIAVGPFADKIPETTRVKAQAAVAGMTRGDLHAFNGPLQRQNGTNWLAAGQEPSDPELHSMTFYVDGMEAQLPGTG